MADAARPGRERSAEEREARRRARVPREVVVQSFLDLFEAPRYLEIGVSQGVTFLPLRAAEKVAVDPAFLPGTVDAIRAQPGAEAHEVTSDCWFGGPGGERRFDVIYLDGLHTLEQTLRDLLNAVACLRHPGVIVVDDVVPKSYAGSLPDFEAFRALSALRGGGGRGWMGDVYRLTYFVETFLQQFSFRTVADNHGQLVLWRRRREAVPERSLEAVARVPYERVHLDRPMQRRAPLSEIVAEVAADLGLRASSAA